MGEEGSCLLQPRLLGGFASIYREEKVGCAIQDNISLPFSSLLYISRMAAIEAQFVDESAQPYEADLYDDDESYAASTVSSGATSLDSRTFDYQYENGRR